MLAYLNYFAGCTPRTDSSQFFRIQSCRTAQLEHPWLDCPSRLDLSDLDTQFCRHVRWQLDDIAIGANQSWCPNIFWRYQRRGRFPYLMSREAKSTSDDRERHEQECRDFHFGENHSFAGSLNESEHIIRDAGSKRLSIGNTRYGTGDGCNQR